MAGTCTGTITVVIAYREAKLVGCNFSPTSLSPGATFTFSGAIETGTVTESYKYVLSGDLTGESAAFSVTGTPTVQPTMQAVTFTMPATATAGTKSITVTLVKV